MVQDMEIVRRWARLYYRWGWNPIPSCGHAKKPALRSGQVQRYRDHERIPREWIHRWWAPNIQVALGVRWRLCVIDIDSPAALSSWMKMIRGRFQAWVSAAPQMVGRMKDFTGRRHLWFRIPESVESLPTVVLWKGQKGEEIKLLADRAMAVAPPSVHPTRNTRYEWLAGPDDGTPLGDLPGWILDRVLSLAGRSQVSPRPRPQHRPLPLGPGFGPHYQRDEVLFSLGDRKHEIAARYGLQHKRHPNLAGFFDCRSIDRDDRDWSCTIDPRTGVYHDFATNQRLSFFDLLMRLAPGEFPSFTETVDRLGSWIFGGNP